MSPSTSRFVIRWPAIRDLLIFPSPDGEAPGKHRKSISRKLKERRYADSALFQHYYSLSRISEERQCLRCHQTVDQEVGGSTPPSCTNSLKDLGGFLGAPHATASPSKVLPSTVFDAQQVRAK